MVDTEEGRAAIHFQQWWVKHRAALAAHQFMFVGIDAATPAGVLDAIWQADVPAAAVQPGGEHRPDPGRPGHPGGRPRNPSPVVGVSGIVGGRPVKGMADACLAAIGVPADSASRGRALRIPGEGGIPTAGSTRPVTLPRGDPARAWQRRR